MDIYEAIEKRRTIRVYRKGTTEEQLRKIILAGTKAPSGGNSQPWEFIVIDDPKIIDLLGEIKFRLNRTFTPQLGETQQTVEDRALFQKKSFENATIVAVCCSAEQAVNGWLCIENMSLVAVAEGLGTGIVSYWGEAKKEAERTLGIPEKYELVCVLKIGVPGEVSGPRKMRPESSWLHRNKF
jgi:5,6-dimethylbenzimidazole synthase